MKTGDWVMYEATHQNTKERRLGQVRWLEPHWVDITWHWLSEYANTAVLFNSSTVMRKYCTPLTEEVAQIFLTANKTKE
jgi:hypothetical protein